MFLKKSVKFWVTFLFLVSLIKGLLWAFMVPIFQAPDEPQHYSYVQYLAEKQSFPYVKELKFEPSERLKKQMEILETEQIAHNPHIQHAYYRQSSDRHPHESLQHREVATLDPTPSEYNYIHNYGPLYYTLNLPLYFLFEPDLVKQVYSMRILSVLLSCLTVVLAFLSMRKLPHFSDKIALPAALFISFLPQFSFISGSINNDNLLILFFTLFFYLAVNWFDKILNFKQILIFILIALLALITKTQGIFLIIITGAYILWRHQKSKSVTVVFSTAVGLVLALTLLFQEVVKKFFGQWELIQSYFMEHSLLWFIQTITFTRLFRTYKSFVGRFGWLDTLLPEWAYIAFFLLLIAGLIGLIFFVYKHCKEKRTLQMVIFFAASIILVDLSYTMLFARNAVLTEYYNFPTQGRYYFIVLIPLTALLFWGLKSLSSSGKANYTAWAACYLVFVLNILSILAIIPTRYYL